MSDNYKKSESSWKTLIITACAFLIVGVIFLGFSSYIIENYWSGSLSLKSWAEIGATYGVLAALFTGLAFAGLIVTIAMQREDLSLQREELRESRKIAESQYLEYKKQSELIKIQQFEQTFFKMLEFKISLLENISISYELTVLNGKPALFTIIKKFDRYMPGQELINDPANAQSLYQDAMAFENLLDEHSVLGLKEWASHICALGMYLNQYDSNNEIYRTVLNNQLSDIERVLMFYMGIFKIITTEQIDVLNKLKLNQLVPKNMLFKRHRKLLV